MLLLRNDAGRGERQVAATARDVGSLEALTKRYGDHVSAMPLDVTDKAAVDATIAAAHERFGRFDVVINNAGYGLFGTIEEVSEAQARAQIDTNLFGALWVTQAAFPTVGLYHASKWGLEGFSQALAAEVGGFGIKVTLIEPGGYATEWGGASAIKATHMPAYDGARAAMAAFRGNNVPGNPEATGPAILKLVDASDPPLRIFFGSGGLSNGLSLEAQGDYAARQKRA